MTTTQKLQQRRQKYKSNKIRMNLKELHTQTLKNISMFDTVKTFSQQFKCDVVILLNDKVLNEIRYPTIKHRLYINDEIIKNINKLKDTINNKDDITQNTNDNTIDMQQQTILNLYNTDIINSADKSKINTYAITFTEDITLIAYFEYRKWNEESMIFLEYCANILQFHINSKKRIEAQKKTEDKALTLHKINVCVKIFIDKYDRPFNSDLLKLFVDKYLYKDRHFKNMDMLGKEFGYEDRTWISKVITPFRCAELIRISRDNEGNVIEWIHKELINYVMGER